MSGVVPAELLTGGPLRAAFEGIQRRLEELFPPAKYQHGVVEPKLDAADWKELLRRTPFVGLGWGGADPSEQSGRRLELGATFTVFVAVRNVAGPTERHLGDRVGPGLMTMAIIAAGGLHGLTLKPPRAGEAVGTIAVTAISHLSIKSVTEKANAVDRVHERDLAIAGIDLRVPFELPWTAEADDWLRLAAQWEVNLPADAPEPAPGPADATPSADVILQEPPA